MYILNQNSGILHAKDCADAPVAGVKAGRKQHFDNYDNAINHADYIGDHKACIE